MTGTTGTCKVLELETLEDTRCFKEGLPDSQETETNELGIQDYLSNL